MKALFVLAIAAIIAAPALASKKERKPASSGMAIVEESTDALKEKFAKEDAQEAAEYTAKSGGIYDSDEDYEGAIIERATKKEACTYDVRMYTPEKITFKKLKCKKVK